MNSHSEVFDDDEIELTALEVFNDLRKAWLNEKLAPELLVHRSDLVSCVMEELKKIDVDARKQPKGDISATLKKMEVIRIKYVVTNYLKTRLKKIEKFVFGILEEDEKRKSDGLEAKMSNEESRFAFEYRKSLEEYLHNAALQHMPANSRSLKPEKIAAYPKFEQYVFARVGAKKIAQISVQDPSDEAQEEIFDLQANSQLIIPYKSIAEHVKNGEVFLI